ncbi:hypothetical protein HMI56_004756 [Coelomomyces lativittatus]|nr:hypothetical protein HMI56_004756 [Coelomomyces lativittatus]
MTAFLKAWETEFNLFSPIGLYSMVGIGSLMAKPGSLTRFEVRHWFLTWDDLHSSWLYQWSKYWIKKI